MSLQAISPSAALLDLQRAAYAVEAELIGDDRIPALHEDLAELEAAGLEWIGSADGDRLVGAVGFSESLEEVDLHRLVVAPEAHRLGIGRTLVEAVLERAGHRRVVVATGRQNRPARSLYERQGFVHLCDVEVEAGLWVSRYERVSR